MPDLDNIARRVTRAVTEKVFPGCVVGIVRKNSAQTILPFGRFTYDPVSPEIEQDTIYDVASITKSIPVASLAAVFEREGRLKFSDPIVLHIPELHNDFGATLKDLLLYRVRGQPMSALPFQTPDEISAHIFERGFAGPPGEIAYTNLPAFLLGIILERIAGEMLPQIAHKYFFGPLGMDDTTFLPRDASRITPTEIIGGNEIRGIVHDESARIFALSHKAVGHAGLFSNAPDLLSFLNALLQGRFPGIIELAERGLGWQRAQSWFMGRHCSEHAFGKTGFTGTSILMDRRCGIGVVILSNRTYPKRPQDSFSIYSAVNSLRADIADIVNS
jgi:CubicO group peptidase (beta-lactamase class C family)